MGSKIKGESRRGKAQSTIEFQGKKGTTKRAVSERGEKRQIVLKCYFEGGR